MPRDVDALVDQVAAATGRVRITDAIVGRRRALARIAAEEQDDQQDQLASDRRSFRILYYLLYLLLVIGVYTGLISMGLQGAADRILEALIVLGAVAAWWEHRHARARPVDDPDDDEPTVHSGFSDDPKELEEQLAELRPAGLLTPGRPLTRAEAEEVMDRWQRAASGVIPALPVGPPMYAYVCGRCGFDPLVDAAELSDEDRRAIAVDALAERTADAGDRGPR